MQNSAKVDILCSRYKYRLYNTVQYTVQSEDVNSYRFRYMTKKKFLDSRIQTCVFIQKQFVQLEMIVHVHTTFTQINILINSFKLCIIEQEPKKFIQIVDIFNKLLTGISENHLKFGFGIWKNGLKITLGSNRRETLMFNASAHHGIN